MAQDYRVYLACNRPELNRLALWIHSSPHSFSFPPFFTVSPPLPCFFILQKTSYCCLVTWYYNSLASRAEVPNPLNAMTLLIQFLCCNDFQPYNCFFFLLLPDYNFASAIDFNVTNHKLLCRIFDTPMKGLFSSPKVS